MFRNHIHERYGSGLIYPFASSAASFSIGCRGKERNATKSPAKVSNVPMKKAAPGKWTGAFGALK